MSEPAPTGTGVKKQVHRKKNYDMKFCECGCGNLIFISDRWGDKHRFVNNHSKKGKSKYSNPKMIPCACGCGTLIPEFDKWGKNHIFVKGHHTKGKDINKVAKTNLILCACGCGTLIPEMNRWGKKCKYVHNHCKRGKSPSEETRRKLSEAKIGKKHTNEARKKMSKSGRGRVFSEEHKRRIGEANKGKKRSAEAILNMTGVGNHRYGKKASPELRQKMSKSRSGEKNHMYIDGRSFLPYCQKFNKELKEKVRIRDARICQNCGVKENGEKHSVHHIHYDKENCYPDLITVCRSCNARANTNKEYWEPYYMNKLNDRGLLHWTQKILICE